MTEKHKKIIWSALIGIVLILTIIPAARNLIFERHLFRAVDAKSTEYVDQALKNAGAAYVLARGFNAVISVFQESEVQLEPAGVGVSLALGQALDPVNDLVERFSWVMLASLTSLGIQKFLIEITPFVSIRILLSLALVFSLAGLWLAQPSGSRLAQIGKVLLFSAIVLRFAVPGMAYMNHQVYVSFLETRHDQSVEKLNRSTSALETYALDEGDGAVGQEDGDQEAGGRVPAESKGWLGQTRDKLNQAVEQGKRIFDVNSKFRAVQRLAQETIGTIVDLIVVFILNTIVLPLGFLWGIVRLGRLIAVRGFDFGKGPF